MNFIDMSDYHRPARIYWSLIVALGTLTGLRALAQCLTYSPAQWSQFIALAVLLVIACAHPIRHPNSTGSFSAGDTFIFLGVIFLGVPAAVVLGILDSLTTTLRTSKRAVAIIGAPAIMGLTAFVSGHVFYQALSFFDGVQQQPLGTITLNFKQLFAPMVLMTLAHYLTNTLLVASMYAVKKRCSLWREWRTHNMWLSVHFFAAGVAAAIIYMAVARFGLIYVLLGLPVIIASYAAYRVYFERVNEQVREAAEMARLHLATVEALATAIDAKDQTTHCHVRRLQIYATGMGRLLHLSTREIEALSAGSLLHDIGKLAVPDHILNDPGKLAPADFEKMKLHTVVGAQILERVDFPYPVVPVVRHHHEQWDGGGYPDALRGEQIPITARILSVVDCYDSVREDRPFRRGMTRTEATALLLRGASTRFDPHLVQLFLQNLSTFEAVIAAQGLDEGLTSDDATAAGENAPPDHVTRAANANKLTRQPAPTYLDQIKDAQKEVYAFYQIARTFGSSLDIEDTISILVNKIGHVVPFDTCAVYLYDEQKKTATVAHAAGAHAEALCAHTVTHGKGLIGVALAEMEANGYTAPALEFAGANLSAENNSYRSMAVIPLAKEHKLFGALVLYSATLPEYTRDHMRLMDTIARLASDALANAIHHAEVESNSLTDALTGLPNSRCMHLHYEQEVARARRSDTPIHVIMLDLDDFKAVNDTFGHKIGDHLLRDAGQLMKAQLREYDFLARYAGDEFVVIVQGLVSNQAEELCERIESVVTKYSLPVHNEHEARVGLSAGIAVYGADGETLDQLLMAADKAMYRVKAQHKHRKAELVDAANSNNLATIAVN